MHSVPNRVEACRDFLLRGVGRGWGWGGGVGGVGWGPGAVPGFGGGGGGWAGGGWRVGGLVPPQSGREGGGSGRGIMLLLLRVLLKAIMYGSELKLQRALPFWETI